MSPRSRTKKEPRANFQVCPNFSVRRHGRRPTKPDARNGLNRVGLQVLNFSHREIQHKTYPLAPSASSCARRRAREQKKLVASSPSVVSNRASASLIAAHRSPGLKVRKRRINCIKLLRACASTSTESSNFSMRDTWCALRLVRVARRGAGKIRGARCDRSPRSTAAARWKISFIFLPSSFNNYRTMPRLLSRVKIPRGSGKLAAGKSVDRLKIFVPKFDFSNSFAADVLVSFSLLA